MSFATMQWRFNVNEDIAMACKQKCVALLVDVCFILLFKYLNSLFQA